MKRFTKALVLLVALLALASPAAAEEPVKCDLTLYGWLAGLDGEELLFGARTERE